jgi:hypothetical protein
MVYIFYICSDKNQSATADKKRMQNVANGFRALGHKAVLGDIDPNGCNNPPAACKGKNDVFV